MASSFNTEPKDHGEYARRYNDNCRITESKDGTIMHLPCPFCAASDFISYQLMETETALNTEIVCRECQRGLRTIIHKSHGQLRLEFIQTRGNDPPPWVEMSREPVELTA
jgi:hypothetical protein